jgi:hypothetical protein
MLLSKVLPNIYLSIVLQRPKLIIAIPIEPNPFFSLTVLSRLSTLVDFEKAIFLTISYAILSSALTLKG